MEEKHGTEDMNNRIAMEVLIENKTFEFRRLALDEKVRESGIIAYDSYSGRDTLVAYVNKYGYPAVNAFVKMLGDELSRRGETNE